MSATQHLEHQSLEPPRQVTSVADTGDDLSIGPSYTHKTPNVYDWCMAKSRTNIEIEMSHLTAIMDRYGVHTKTEAVDLALRHLAGQPMSRDEAMAMRGVNAIDDVPDEAPAPL